MDASTAHEEFGHGSLFVDEDDVGAIQVWDGIRRLGGALQIALVGVLVMHSMPFHGLKTLMIDRIIIDGAISELPARLTPR